LELVARFLGLLQLGLYFIAWPSLAASRVDCSFLLGHLLKNQQHETTALPALSDLDFYVPPSFEFLGSKVFENQTKEDRFHAISQLKLEQIIAAPGHRFLRKPQQVEGLTKYIKESHGGDFGHDKILLNIVTYPDGKVKEVDLWNAHHRFLAYRLAGYETLGQLELKNIDILVNGLQTTGEPWKHYLPAAGVDLRKLEGYDVVPVGGEIRVGTIAVSGRFTNYELGSRNTIGQLLKNTLRESQPKVGVYFGTFDPIHEGHVRVAKSALKNFELDEVLMVPNIHSIEKPLAADPNHRIAMLALRLKDEKGLNLYTEDSSVLIDRFGREPFFERVGQIYGTKKVFQVVGLDSFEKLLSQGNVRKDSNLIYLVSLRQDLRQKLNVPDDLKPLVFLLPSDSDSALSSTKIRDQISANQSPSQDELNPKVLNYIQKHQLYRKPKVK
jgi:nicotinate-nucleotide adenylyltransferase